MFLEITAALLFCLKRSMPQNSEFISISIQVLLICLVTCRSSYTVSVAHFGGGGGGGI